MSLAAKLPWNHRFAGGYPGLSSQPLPTDADAIDYLSRMATADGAGVEVGVATAVDAFFRDTKAAGVFDDLKACCILAGARTLAGALVPVVGDAPTATAFTGGDYSRTAGLTGDGATTYLDSGRANDADAQNDNHNAVYATAIGVSNGVFIAAGNADHLAAGTNVLAGGTSNNVFGRNRSAAGTDTGSLPAAGFIAANRSVSGEYVVRNGESETTASVASQTPTGDNILLFRRGSGSFAYSAHTIAFYSIGSSLDLAALDSHISSYVTAIGAAI